MLQLKQKDIQYFDKLQRDYNNTITYYRDLVEFMKGWISSMNTNKYFLTGTSLEYEIEHQTETKSINKHTESLIYYICSYLRSEYGLSGLSIQIESRIKSKYIKYESEKYNNDGLTYTDIINDICDMLNITDLNSATIDQLRDRVIDYYKYDFEYDRVKSTKNKIKITDYAIRTSDGWDRKCHLDDESKNKIIDTLKAYNYISTGKLEVTKDIEDLFKSLSNYHSVKYEDYYKTHTLNFMGVSDVTFYKNTSIQYKFNSDESREKFIRIMKGDF